MPTVLMWEFAVAGGIGFGFGGFCMMQALKRLGSPHALLAVESITAVFAGFLAWVVLEDKMTFNQILCCGVILIGVFIAGSSGGKKAETITRDKCQQGYYFAYAASLFQALSLVISRHAFLEARTLDTDIDKFNAAFIRLLGGVVIALVLWMLLKLRSRNNPASLKKESSRLFPKMKPLREQPWVWVIANALFGPVLGVTCWLWAVSKLNPGIVQSIAATAPMIAIPISRLMESRLIERRFFIGAPIAILGITALIIW